MITSNRALNTDHLRPTIAGELIFVRDAYDRAVDSGANQTVKHQVSASITALHQSLYAVDADLKQLVKLDVCYVQHATDERRLLELLSACLGGIVKVVITLIPLSSLPRAGQLVQVSAIAMYERDRDTVTLATLADPGASACHGLRCGAFTFTHGQSAIGADDGRLYAGDLVSQNRYTLDALNTILEALGTPIDSIVKANSWRADAPSDAAYTQAANDRFGFFSSARPAVTGITIAGLAPMQLLNRLDVWAMDNEFTRRRFTPAQHWGWKLETSYSHGLAVGDWLFVGGQAALDEHCAVCFPGQFDAQMKLTMHYVNAVLSAGQFAPADVVKTATYYCVDSVGSGEFSALMQAYSDALGPVPNVVPVEHLAYPQQSIEIEAIAFRGRAQHTS